MKTDANKLRKIIRVMRDAYEEDKNAMIAARSISGQETNDPVATLIAYDLQAGTYNAARRKNGGFCNAKDMEIASFIKSYLPEGGDILEVGCGEATRLGGVLTALEGYVRHAFGFDLSWSRVNEGKRWLQEHGTYAKLFVGDLFEMPLGDASVDIVYTSHSLEPNGGREEEAVRECLRVASIAVVLIEPIYELSNEDARERMVSHGYVSRLLDAAERIGTEVTEYRLLEHIGNPLNPSGVLILKKNREDKAAPISNFSWRCPLTGTSLHDLGDVFFANEVGLAYPVLRGIPMLRPEHGIVASGLESFNP